MSTSTTDVITNMRAGIGMSGRQLSYFLHSSLFLLLFSFLVIVTLSLVFSVISKGSGCDVMTSRRSSDVVTSFVKAGGG